MGCSASSVFGQGLLCAVPGSKIDNGMEEKSASVRREQRRRPYIVHAERVVRVMNRPEFGGRSKARHPLCAVEYDSTRALAFRDARTLL